MLNSLASYFWGSTTNEQDCTDKNTPEQHGEHLEAQQEEDWVVIRTDGKENKLECAHHGSHHRHNNHHNHTHHHNNHHYHNHAQQSKCSLCEEHEPSPQNFSGASDADVLDDAAALAWSMSADDNGQLPTASETAPTLCSHHDPGWVSLDSDKTSDTESLPESVFSASSCRSHATYHPGGNQTEPWVVAPPPCFTGSQTGELPTVASSPLENLLIEHPSMSVYLSYPLSDPLISNRPPGETIASDQQEEAENREANEQPEVNDQENVQAQEEFHVLQQRNINHAAVHPGQVSAQQLIKSIHLAHRKQYNNEQKLISKNKCERENKVQECHSHGKGNSRRNKRMRPSGFRSSRFNQRF